MVVAVEPSRPAEDICDDVTVYVDGLAFTETVQQTVCVTLRGRKLVLKWS